eukprot:GGOE01041509.1.p1 GENE.GGOE01041509.1~~GGOE01041509.1.p1  ORF type:complete len:402 (+),score=67.94 GGOE01041509.1:31-1236(+)
MLHATSAKRFFVAAMPFFVCGEGVQPPLKHSKVLLFIAYIGTSFHGSARSGPKDMMPTIESTLWKVIDAVRQEASPSGVTMPSFSGALVPGFSSSSRTDKGVHAVCNSFCFVLEDCCLGPHGGNNIIFGGGQTGGFLVKLNAALPESDMWALCATTVPRHFHAKRDCECRRYEYLIPINIFLQSPVEEVGEDFGIGGMFERHEQQLTLLRSMKRPLKKFVGLWSFHNFAPGLGPEDERAKRRVFRVYCRDLISKGGVDFVRISISGRSFLQLQIRRMMGLFIACMTGVVPAAYIDLALSATPDVFIPTAPAHLLYQAECKFKLNCLPVAMDSPSFRAALCIAEDRICEHIAALERQQQDVQRFLGELLPRHVAMQAALQRWQALGCSGGQGATPTFDRRTD